MPYKQNKREASDKAEVLHLITMAHHGITLSEIRDVTSTNGISKARCDKALSSLDHDACIVFPSRKHARIHALSTEQSSAVLDKRTQYKRKKEAYASLLDNLAKNEIKTNNRPDMALTLTTTQMIRLTALLEKE